MVVCFLFLNLTGFGFLRIHKHVLYYNIPVWSIQWIFTNNINPVPWSRVKKKLLNGRKKGGLDPFGKLEKLFKGNQKVKILVLFYRGRLLIGWKELTQKANKTPVFLYINTLIPAPLLLSSILDFNSNTCHIHDNGNWLPKGIRLYLHRPGNAPLLSQLSVSDGCNSDWQPRWYHQAVGKG